MGDSHNAPEKKKKKNINMFEGHIVSFCLKRKEKELYLAPKWKFAYPGGISYLVDSDNKRGIFKKKERERNVNRLDGEVKWRGF